MGKTEIVPVGEVEGVVYPLHLGVVGLLDELVLVIGEALVGVGSDPAPVIETEVEDVVVGLGAVHGEEGINSKGGILIITPALLEESTEVIGVVLLVHGAEDTSLEVGGGGGGSVAGEVVVSVVDSGVDVSNWHHWVVVVDGGHGVVGGVVVVLGVVGSLSGLGLVVLVVPVTRVVRGTVVICASVGVVWGISVVPVVLGLVVGLLSLGVVVRVVWTVVVRGNGVSTWSVGVAVWKSHAIVVVVLGLVVLLVGPVSISVTPSVRVRVTPWVTGVSVVSGVPVVAFLTLVVGGLGLSVVLIVPGTTVSISIWVSVAMSVGWVSVVAVISGVVVVLSLWGLVVLPGVTGMSISIGWGVTVAVSMTISWVSIGTISVPVVLSLVVIGLGLGVVVPVSLWVVDGGHGVVTRVPVWILLVGILVGSLVVLIVPGTTVAISIWVSVMSTISWVSIAVVSVPVVGLILVLGGLGLSVVVPVALWVMDGGDGVVTRVPVGVGLSGLVLGLVRALEVVGNSLTLSVGNGDEGRRKKGFGEHLKNVDRYIDFVYYYKSINL